MNIILYLYIKVCHVNNMIKNDEHIYELSSNIIDISAW